MAAPIEFYFDFSSPYSYLASERIEALAVRHGRQVRYLPILLGVSFKISGMRPLAEIPMKGDYSRRDFARSARFAGVPFVLPSPFPIATVGAARAYLSLEEHEPALAGSFLHAAFRAYFAQGRNISDGPVLAEVLREVGANADSVMAAIQQPEIKERLRAQVDSAIERGVFGAPFMFVDGEPFWGHDRLAQLERWLATGPF